MIILIRRSGLAFEKSAEVAPFESCEDGVGLTQIHRQHMNDNNGDDTKRNDNDTDGHTNSKPQE